MDDTVYVVIGIEPDDEDIGEFVMCSTINKELAESYYGKSFKRKGNNIEWAEKHLRTDMYVNGNYCTSFIPETDEYLIVDTSLDQGVVRACYDIKALNNKMNGDKN